MRLTILLFIIVIVPKTSYCIGLNTGGDVLKACTEMQAVLDGESDNRTEALACANFLMGFDSGQSVVSRLRNVSGVHCAPKGRRIGEMVSTVVVYLKSNSNLHKAPAGIAVWKALESAWPCDK